MRKYNAIQQRFDLITEDHTALLKAGIKTKNKYFNTLIDRMELICTNSDAPILIQGETGTGKSELASRLYELKKIHKRIIMGVLFMLIAVL